MVCLGAGGCTLSPHPPCRRKRGDQRGVWPIVSRAASGSRIASCARATTPASSALRPKRSRRESSVIVERRAGPCGRTAAATARASPPPPSSDTRLPTERPISVSPRSFDRVELGLQDRPVATARDRVGRGGGVGERAGPVARPKSSYRNRSVTVRPARPAVRIRRVTRSTMPEQQRLDRSRSTSGRVRAPTATRSSRAGDRSRRRRGSRL